MDDLKKTHAGGVVQVSRAPGERYGILPRSIPEDLRIPPDARLVAAWLATQQPGFQVVVGALATRLGLGKEKWQRIARQLQAAGYLRRSCAPSGPGGRWVWTTFFYADASAISAADQTGAGKPGAGVVGDGCDGHIRRQAEENKQEENKKEKRERARGPARNEFETDEKTGIQHNPNDHRDQQALLAILKHPASAVEAAVTQAKGLDDLARAFPSAVLRILLAKRVAGSTLEQSSTCVPRSTLGMDFSNKKYERQPI